MLVGTKLNVVLVSFLFVVMCVSVWVLRTHQELKLNEIYHYYRSILGERSVLKTQGLLVYNSGKKVDSISCVFIASI